MKTPARRWPESFDKVIPILRIFDVAKAREFYVGFLGMVVDWEHRFSKDAPLYMQVSRGGLVLHLSEHYGDACPGSTVFVRMIGLKAYHKEITAKNYSYLRRDCTSERAAPEKLPRHSSRAKGRGWAQSWQYGRLQCPS